MWQLPAELVISSSWQTGVHHVSHQHSRTSQHVCPSFLFLQCPKPNDKMSSSQIIQHSWGTARCAPLLSRCSKNILTRVSAKKTGDVSAALTFIPLWDPDCTLSWTAVYSLTLGGCFLATRLMLKIKQPMQNKQKSLLAKSVVGVCYFKNHWVACIGFLMSLPLEKEWREV